MLIMQNFLLRDTNSIQPVFSMKFVYYANTYGTSFLFARDYCKRIGFARLYGIMEEFSSNECCEMVRIYDEKLLLYCKNFLGGQYHLRKAILNAVQHLRETGSITI
ncbi:hypothetical protein AVEN_135087-1 [Araneus ventricosus]|uniref:Uncharacterized protein n=1 Tax=Araneus ventricosus TaxID=182803 RepID=A0A4Y2RLU8_ARAVE|nr:hypothetical protein AVEN_229230-1 [Araneus ventricosus]GBN75943.1 hypothetical protein AVEN_37769-1 [Araneus ventricosus]GBN76364.1 hypothetical protein AVEN_135087-1 [Araneus ventricosus]